MFKGRLKKQMEKLGFFREEGNGEARFLRKGGKRRQTITKAAVKRKADDDDDEEEEEEEEEAGSGGRQRRSGTIQDPLLVHFASLEEAQKLAEQGPVGTPGMR